MTEQITPANSHLVPQEAHAAICQKILDIPSMQERVKNGAPKTNGVALFEGFPLSDGRKVCMLVEYQVDLIHPLVGIASIREMVFSDEKMPDLFLDIINHYRENYVEGSMQWFQRDKKEGE